MIGLPPGAGFVSKWYLLLAALDTGKYLFVAVIFISTLLMVVYFWRVIEIMYIRTDNATIANPSLRIEETPFSILGPGLVLSVLTFVMGLIWLTGTLTPLLRTINTSFGLGGGT
jgi:multicomponent Na+:H+ antiporter subunit D